MRSTFLLPILFLLALSAQAQSTKYIAAGYPFSNTSALLVGSDDLSQWKTLYEGNHSAFVGVTYGNNTYVAVTEKIGVLYSTDGTNWQEANLPADISNSTADTKGIAFGDGMFVIVGSNHLILYSTNGKDWKRWGDSMAEKKLESAGAGAANRVKNNALNKVAGGNREALNASNTKQGTSVTAGDGGIDPETAIGRTHFFAVNFVNGYFFVLGNKDRIGRFKADGKKLGFIDHFAGGADLVPTTRGVAYGNNTYVVVATQSAYVSTDGATWKSTKIGAEGWKVCFGNGLFTMVNTFGQAWYSKDGMTWTKANLKTGKLFDLVYTGKEFIATGEKNIVRSKDGISWTVTEMAFDKKFMLPTFKSILLK